VLGVPRKHGFDLLAWVIPLGGIALGAVVLGVGVRRWSRAEEVPLDPEDERRVDEELDRFE
jgi:cytochrome c-type biogenesis protein CcmH/NrfF